MSGWFWEMTFSDWNMVIFGLLVLAFLIDYIGWSPWWEHPIGYVVIIYGISVLLLVSLILYGMVAGQRVDEWLRVLVTLLLIIGILGKIVILHYERSRPHLAPVTERERLLAARVAELEHELARTGYSSNGGHAR